MNARDTKPSMKECRGTPRHSVVGGCQKPRKIFLMVGINDLLQYNRNASYISTNYETILNRIRSESPNTVVYIESILPVDIQSTHSLPVNASSKIIASNNELKDLADGNKTIFINLYPYFCGSDNRLYASYTIDGIHLRPFGYAVWINLIDRYVYSNSSTGGYVV